MPRKTAKKRPTKSPDVTSTQRLQRVLAGAGFGSRRQCEELIEDGRVHVDGVVVDKLGTNVDPEVNKILVDGQVLRKQKLVYYAVNKPVGVVTTNRDPQGRPRVVDLVPPDERVFPVGRLDLSSEGLILLTNDGELAQKLTHPSFGVRKVYRVTVAGKVENETMKKMREGIYISEGFVQVDGAKLLKARARATELEITLREGKNREIRRILARLGHKVQQLRRIAVGPLRLGDLPAGAYRIVRREDVEKLRSAVESAEKESASHPRPKSAKKSVGARKTYTSKTGTPTKKKAFKSSDRKSGRDNASNETPTVLLPTKSSTGGAIIGGDVRPKLDRTGQKPHVVKPRPTGAKRKAAKNNSAPGASRGTAKRGQQRRTKKR